MTLLSITLPIFILIAFGYALRMARGIDEGDIRTLNNFVYWVSLPAIILVSFWGIDWFDAVTRSVLAINMFAIIGCAAVLFVCVQLLPCARETKAGIFVSAIVSNTVYMGFPIGQRAFGEGGYDVFLAAATPHLVVGTVLSVLAIEWFVLGSHSPVRYVKDIALNPLILALVAGIVLSVSGVSGAALQVLAQPLMMLGATASPIALVTLGAFLRGALDTRLLLPALTATTLKLMALPLAMFGAGIFFVLPEPAHAASVLAAAMPTAVTSFVVATKYNAAPRLVATTLVLSTLISFGTITLVLYLVL